MTLLDIFGQTKQVEWWQELPRAVVIFVYGLLLLRISGRRTFARWSALDIILSVITGSCLGRALTGGAPLEPQMLHYNISETDCHEALRVRGIQDVAQTRRITLEPSGNITVLTG